MHFAPKQSGRNSDGVASDDASVVTGTEDATFDTESGDKDDREKPAHRSRKD